MAELGKILYIEFKLEATTNIYSVKVCKITNEISENQN
jgi:hypothetical protein